MHHAACCICHKWGGRNLSTEEVLDEKAELIKNILEMSRTLDDITNKIADVKKDTIRLKQENEVINEYVANLMEQSKTFEPTDLGTKST